MNSTHTSRPASKIASASARSMLARFAAQQRNPYPRPRRLNAYSKVLICRDKRSIATGTRTRAAEGTYEGPVATWSQPSMGTPRMRWARTGMAVTGFALQIQPFGAAACRCLPGWFRLDKAEVAGSSPASPTTRFAWPGAPGGGSPVRPRCRARLRRKARHRCPRLGRGWTVGESRCQARRARQRRERSSPRRRCRFPR